MKKTQWIATLVGSGALATSLIAADAFNPAGGQTTSAFSQSSSGGNHAILNVSGQNVTDASGQQVGQIQHLVLGEGGCIDLALLSLGQAGQSRLVAVPWQLVSFQGGASAAASGSAAGTTASRSAQASMFKLNVDQAKLQRAPAFTANQIYNITQQQTLQQVYQYYGTQPGSAQGSAGRSSDSLQGSSQSSSQSSATGQSTSTQGSAAAQGSASAGLGSQAGVNQPMTNLQGSLRSSTNLQSGAFGSQTNMQSGQGSTGSGQETIGGSSSSSQFPTNSVTNRQDRNLPPGLEKRETLPPGLEKRDTLPPGLERRTNSSRQPTR